MSKHKKSNQYFSKFENSKSSFKKSNHEKSNHKFSKLEKEAIGKSNQADSNSSVKYCDANIVYECANKKEFVLFLHTATFSPVPDTWAKAIKAGHFTTWPGLTEELLRKHLPKEVATVKVHLNQQRKNIQSTTRPVPMIVNPIHDDDFEVDPPCSCVVKTHHVFTALGDVGKIYGDLT
jgi:hypothetical protein